jgi:hypothetical protein
VATLGQLRAVLFKAFAVLAASAPLEDLAGPGHHSVPSSSRVI